MVHINHLTGVHIDLHLLRGALNQILVKDVGRCMILFLHERLFLIFCR